MTITKYIKIIMNALFLQLFLQLDEDEIQGNYEIQLGRKALL